MEVYSSSSKGRTSCRSWSSTASCFPKRLPLVVVSLNIFESKDVEGEWQDWKHSCCLADTFLCLFKSKVYCFLVAALGSFCSSTAPRFCLVETKGGSGWALIPQLSSCNPFSIEVWVTLVYSIETGPGTACDLSCSRRFNRWFCRSSLRFCFLRIENSSLRLWRLTRAFIRFLMSVYSCLGTNLRRNTNFFMLRDSMFKAKSPSLTSPGAILAVLEWLISCSYAATAPTDEGSLLPYFYSAVAIWFKKASVNVSDRPI